MCGIAGFTWDNSDLIKKMLSKLTHRGPDERGYLCEKNVSLGNQRLRIIDLSIRGKQPIFNEDQSAYIVLNGEIFNYKEIRQNLESKNHIFNTNTDTEVILHAYEEYNINCLNLFNGQFAFAIWANNELFIARDRIGIIPLYYLEIDGKFIFASEIKSILEFEDYKPKVNLNALHNYLCYGYNRLEETIFQGIKKLSPAHYMIIKKGKIVSNTPYWAPYQHDSNISFDIAVKKLQNLVIDAVEKNMVSDVPIGIYLSGGIDSSAVLGCLACIKTKKGESGPITTFSVGFGELGESELNYARIVADEYNTEHNEVIVEFDGLMSKISKMIWHLDEPMNDLACIPIAEMSELARKNNIIVALGGDGNDEVWGGYDHYSKFYNNYKLVKSIPIFYISHLKFFSRLFKPDIREKVNLAFDLVKDRVNFRYYAYSFKDFQKKEVFTQEVSNKIIPLNNMKFPRDELLYQPKKDYRKQLMLSDLIYLIPDMYALKTDKMAMSAGVEFRVPLLDYRIVKFAFTLPSEYKIIRGTEKYIFRIAMKDYISKSVIHRKKRGFDVPIHLWAKNLKEEFTAFFDDSLLLKFGIIREEILQKVLKKLNNPSKFDGHRAWNLLVCELWFRMYIVNKNS